MKNKKNPECRKFSLSVKCVVNNKNYAFTPPLDIVTSEMDREKKYKYM